MDKPLNDLKYKARRILLLGTTGTGKSTLAHRLLMLHPASLILVYDWQGGEFADRLGLTVATSREELGEQLDEGKRIICYNPGLEEAPKDELVEDFDWFCSMAFEASGWMPGRKLVVIDEMQELVDPYDMPDSLDRVLTRGRRRRIDTLCLADAPNALNTKNRNQVSELCCFRTNDENALNFPRSMGLDKTEIQELDDGEFIFKDLRSGEKKRLALFGKNVTPSNEPKPKEFETCTGKMPSESQPSSS